MEYVKIKTDALKSSSIEDAYVFSSFDAMKIVDIPRGRYNQWYQRGYIPEGEKERWGERTKTLYTILDLYSMTLFKRLVDLGINREFASKIYTKVDWGEVKKGRVRYLHIYESQPDQKTISLTTSMNIGSESFGISGWYVDLRYITRFIGSRI